MSKSMFPVAIILLALIVLWYCCSIILNSSWAYDKAERNSKTLTFEELIFDTWSQKKPKLPAPHQVATEMFETIFLKKISFYRLYLILFLV